jgi:hypothetical protein
MNVVARNMTPDEAPTRPDAGPSGCRVTCTRPDTGVSFSYLGSLWTTDRSKTRVIAHKPARNPLMCCICTLAPARRRVNRGECRGRHSATRERPVNLSKCIRRRRCLEAPPQPGRGRPRITGIRTARTGSEDIPVRDRRASRPENGGRQQAERREQQASSAPHIHVPTHRY